MLAAEEATRKELQSLHQILHLAHHRNKNQHRLSKWYKSFSQLRRQISKLVDELTQFHTALAISSVESKYVKNARSILDLRINFMRQLLVPKCYTAFGNLVADNQYAPLGLVIMGVLAGLWRVLEVISPDQEDIQSQNFGLATKAEMKTKNIEDLGEVISRPESQCQSEKYVEESLTSEKQPRKRKAQKEDIILAKPKLIKKVRKSKKPKNYDVFDDIFEGLA